MQRVCLSAAILLASAFCSLAPTPASAAGHASRKLCKIKGTWQAATTSGETIGTYIMRSDTAGTFTFADCPDKIVYHVTVSNESSAGFNVVGMGKKSQFCDRYFTDTQTFDAGSCTATSGTLVPDHGKNGTLSDTWTKTMSAKATPPAGLTRNLK